MKQYELYCLLCVRVCVCHPGLFISRAPHKRFQSTRREKSFGASLNFSYQSAHTLPPISSAVEKLLQVHVCNKFTRENCKIRFSCLLWSHSNTGSEDGQIVFTGATPAYSCWGLRPNLTLQPAARCAWPSGCLQRYSGKHKYQVLREGLRHDMHHTSINLGNTFLHVL